VDQLSTEDIEEEVISEETTTTEVTTPLPKAEENTPPTIQIHKTSTINNKHQRKEPQTMEVEEPRLDKQANGVQIAEKPHTTQPNAGAAGRKR
jgi:hypothetical protein